MHASQDPGRAVICALLTARLAVAAVALINELLIRTDGTGGKVGNIEIVVHGEFGVDARSVPWPQARQVAVEDGRLRVGAEGRWLTLTSTPVRKIPNFYMFLALARNLGAENRGPGGDPAPSPAPTSSEIEPDGFRVLLTIVRWESVFHQGAYFVSTVPANRHGRGLRQRVSKAVVSPMHALVNDAVALLDPACCECGGASPPRAVAAGKIICGRTKNAHDCLFRRVVRVCRCWLLADAIALEILTSGSASTRSAECWCIHRSSRSVSPRARSVTSPPPGGFSTPLLPDTAAAPVTVASPATAQRQCSAPRRRPSMVRMAGLDS
ncbi:DUF6585 family protein [Nocardia abscessus]|uniref:DUF6585 family protein n=1 Tax=Nocardia abscessus TaxID=120957 RepID=UPI003A5D1472